MTYDLVSVSSLYDAAKSVNLGSGILEHQKAEGRLGDLFGAAGTVRVFVKGDG